MSLETKKNHRAKQKHEPQLVRQTAASQPLQPTSSFAVPLLCRGVTVLVSWLAGAECRAHPLFGGHVLRGAQCSATVRASLVLRRLQCPPHVRAAGAPMRPSWWCAPWPLHAWSPFWSCRCGPCAVGVGRRCMCLPRGRGLARLPWVWEDALATVRRRCKFWVHLGTFPMITAIRGEAETTLKLLGIIGNHEKHSRTTGLMLQPKVYSGPFGTRKSSCMRRVATISFHLAVYSRF